MKKSKIAIIDNSIDISGALNAILGYAEYAEHLSIHFLFIITTNSRAVENIKHRGFEVVELPFIEISRNWKKLLMYLPQLLINAIKLNRYIRRYEIDIVHVNDFYNLVAILAKFLGGQFSLITHVRFMPDRFPSMLVKLWVSLNLRYANTLVCVSQAVYRYLPKHTKIQVIYDHLSVIPGKSTKNKSNHSYLKLLYLAHYIPGKGQDYALEAFYKAYQQSDHIRLKFVGGDMGLAKNKAFKNKLMARVQDLKLEDVVDFDGPTINTAKEIQSADIMLNFSESESFSMTCLEALACGTPLIASDCGGPAELFIHQESGLLVSNRDIDSMAEAIVLLVQNEKLREKFTVKAMDYVRKKFAVIHTYDRLEKVHLDMLSIRKNVKA